MNLILVNDKNSDKSFVYIFIEMPVDAHLNRYSIAVLITIVRIFVDDNCIQ
jgi:hypothetical protein